MVAAHARRSSRRIRSPRDVRDDDRLPTAFVTETSVRGGTGEHVRQGREEVRGCPSLASVTPVAFADRLLCLALRAHCDAIFAREPVSCAVGAAFERLGSPADAFGKAADGGVPFCACLSSQMALATAARARWNTGSTARNAVVRGLPCGRVSGCRGGSACACDERADDDAEGRPEGGGTHAGRTYHREPQGRFCPHSNGAARASEAGEVPVVMLCARIVNPSRAVPLYGPGARCIVGGWGCCLRTPRSTK